MVLTACSFLKKPVGAIIADCMLTDAFAFGRRLPYE